MISAEGRYLLMRDLWSDALEEIAEKDRLIKVLRSEVARLNQRRDEFDLSADAQISCLLKLQAG